MPSSAVKLLVGWQEGHLACKNLECWLSDWNHVQIICTWFRVLTSLSSLAASKSRMFWHCCTGPTQFVLETDS